MEQPFFNPLDPAFRVNPVPAYDQLREKSPIHRTPLGGLILTRHADCSMILHHPGCSHDPRNSDSFALLRQQMAERMGEEWQRRRSFLFLDPPDHTRLRGLVSKAFTMRVVEGLRPRMQEVVDELIDRAIDKGEMELIEEFAYPLPIAIISEMIGVPHDDAEMFKGWSRELARGLDPEPMIPQDVLERRIASATAFRDYFTELIEERRKNPRDDLLSALITAEEEGDKLTKDELLSTLILLLIAGHETTVNLIGNGALALMRNPEQFERLRDDPSLAKTAVEEVLRYDPPVLFTGRIAMEDIPIDGEVMRKGEQAILLLGAANRDSKVFDRPDQFDIGRTKNPHLAFGQGIHFCLGAPLARIEGQIAFVELAKRMPHMKLLTDEPEYKENIVLRGLSSLSIAI